MKVLAFAASSSRNSINKQLVTYAAGLLNHADVELLDINDYEMPLFSVDREIELGHPEAAQQFFKKIGDADALLISFAEHNGSFTAAYKNLYDWTSRIDSKVYQSKPIVMLATSPGPGGARNVLAAAITSAPFFGGNVVGDLSVAKYFDQFDKESGDITNDELKAQILEVLKNLKDASL